MIPSDVASSLKQPLLGQQLATQTAPRPVSPTQQVADVLSNLVPGQRILAEIQALLPNGTYRAVVAQRSITLALPFSAKLGDTLELEVTENDGKLTLAVATNRSDSTASSNLKDSVATSFSPAGKLIGNLMGEIGQEGKRAPPAQLNSTQPLVESMPKTASDLAPILKQSLTQSGVFYEAHQARWVAGELPTAALKQEPQANFATPRSTHSFNLTAEVLTANTAKSAAANGTTPAAMAGVFSENETGSLAQNTTAGTIATNATLSTAEKLAATYGHTPNSTPLLDEQGKPSTTNGSAAVTATQETKTTDAGKLSIQSNQQIPTQTNPAPRESTVANGTTPAAMAGGFSEKATGSPAQNTTAGTIATNATLSTAEKLAATYGNAPNSAPLPDERGKLSTTSGPSTVNATQEAKTTDSGKLSIQSNQQIPTQTNPIPRELVPIVQQQLDALATQNYAWHGQIWPGQQMQWEIGENPDEGRSSEHDAIARWQTRLKLALPLLGGVNVVLNLNPADEVNITITTDTASSESRLRDSSTLLSQQMESAGLKLTQISIEHGKNAT